MGNVTIGYPTHRTAAAYTANSVDADYPASNLGTLPLCYPCRSTGVTAAWVLDAVFSSNQVIQMVSLWDANPSISCKRQVEVFDAAADAVEVAPIASGAGSGTVVLHPLIGFTRAGTEATYIGVCGLAATTANEPRFECSPTDGTVTGLLIEARAQNIILQSDALTAAPWSANVGTETVTTSTRHGIDNTVFLASITAPTAGATGKYAAYQQRTAVMSAGSYTLEADVRADTIAFVSLAEGGDAAWHQATFDLSTGGVAGTNSVTDTDLVDLGGGLYRASITFTRTNGGAAAVYIGPAPTAAHSFKDGFSPAGESIYAGRVQCVRGTVGGSYIKTEAAAVTRNADFATITDLDAVGYVAEGGTFYYRARPASGSGTYQYLASIDDGTAGNRITIYRNPSGNIALYVRTGGVDQALLNAGNAPDGTDFRVVIRVGDNDFAIIISGGSISASLSGTIPTGLTTWRFGGNYAVGAEWNGTIQESAYWPTGVADADLESIVAGGDLPTGYTFYADFRTYNAPTVAIADATYDLFVRSESGYEWRSVTVSGGSYTVEPILGDTQVSAYAFFASGALTTRQKAAYATTGSTVAALYDTGSERVYQNEFAEDQCDWDGGRWWDRSYTQKEIESVPRHVRAILSAAWYGKAVRVTLTDATNPDGFLEAGLFDVAAATVLEINWSYGAQYGFRGRTTVQEAHGGTKYRERRPKPRTLTAEITYAPKSQARAVFFEMQRILDTNIPVYVSVDPDDDEIKTRQEFPAHFIQLDPITMAAFGYDRVPFRLEEEL